MDERDSRTDAGTELDVWIGDRDVAWEGGGAGTNRISRILSDRAIHEQFALKDADSALRGESWSVFVAERHLWHQTRVDDQGRYLDLVGARDDGWIAFERAAPERGAAVRQRMVFRDVQPDRFRWSWEFSGDAGATWAVRWGIEYRRRSA